MEPSDHFLELQAWFAKMGFELARIPAELASSMTKPYDYSFSTRPLSMSPYNFESYVTELAWKDIQDYAVVTHAGHGANSHALVFYLVRRPYAVLLHVTFGGIYM